MANGFTWPKGSSWEFRVVWQRNGRRRKTQIVQSWSTAHQKARAILAMDALACTPEYLAACVRDGKEPIPRLVDGPMIEQRRVSVWDDCYPDAQPTEASQGAVDELAWRLGVFFDRPEKEEVDSVLPF